MKRNTIVVVAVLVVVIAAASAYFLWPSAPVVEQELVVSLWEDVDKLDPTVDSLTADFAVNINIYNALVRFKPGTGEIEPDLAEEWSVSDDGLTWTFKLRQGVMWHKGFGEFTAADVKYTYERILDPATGSPWQGDLGSVDTITAVDDYTVAIKLKYPYPGFIYKVSAFRTGFIVNQEAVEQYGADYARNPIGTGPFMFDHWGENNEAVLVAHEDYFEGAPKLQKITFIGMTDESVSVLALESGELHMAVITQPENYKTVLDNPDLEIAEMATTAVYGITFNTNMTPFNDVRVRQALYYATNKTEILELQEGLAVEAKSFLAPAFFGATDDVAQYPYNVDKAKELLIEAGHPDGFTTTAYVTTGTPTLLFTLVQSQWAKVGVTVEMKTVEGGAWFAAIMAGEPPISYMPLGGRPPDPDIPLTMMFHTDNMPPGGLNYFFYGSQEGEGIDELLEAARQEPDDTKRRAMYEQMVKKIADEVPCIPLWHAKNVAGVNPRVKGFVPEPLAYIYGNLYEVYLE